MHKPDGGSPPAFTVPCLQLFCCSTLPRQQLPSSQIERMSSSEQLPWAANRWHHPNHDLVFFNLPNCITCRASRADEQVWHWKEKDCDRTLNSEPEDELTRMEEGQVQPLMLKSRTTIIRTCFRSFPPELLNPRQLYSTTYTEFYIPMPMALDL
jgi:hypothetical protein